MPTEDAPQIESCIVEELENCNLVDGEFGSDDDIENESVSDDERLDVPVSTHQSKAFSGGYSRSFRMSTPTTQAAGTPAAPAAANTVVANSATTGSSLAPTSVVTSTVTTPSSPKRTMSLGEYQKTRGNTVLARDELETLFNVGSNANMEDGEEEDEGTSDRPLADAGPLSSPRSGGDSTSRGTSVLRTGLVRDPWMPTPSEIQSRFGSTTPPSQYALYSCSGIDDDDATKELDFDPWPDPRRDYNIRLFQELRCGYSVCGADGHRVRPLHVGAVRVSEWDINGYTGVRVPVELKTLRTNLIAQMSSSAGGGRSAPSRTVGDYSSRLSFTPFGSYGGGGFCTPSPFPERPASGRSATPTYRGPEEILSNE
ncbi:unnamed protein product [Phytophthora fragariaefolia]|uniref:Unnamed protein product n=1 Tax=Phytophthora fragariaefolia TaxID=1490495 RepID=A0A9W6YK89_9STRA|nr:unnamed protein product [Phytophthora fragariaefolia]